MPDLPGALQANAGNKPVVSRRYDGAAKRKQLTDRNPPVQILLSEGSIDRTSKSSMEAPQVTHKKLLAAQH